MLIRMAVLKDPPHAIAISVLQLDCCFSFPSSYNQQWGFKRMIVYSPFQGVVFASWVSMEFCLRQKPKNLPEFFFPCVSWWLLREREMKIRWDEIKLSALREENKLWGYLQDRKTNKDKEIFKRWLKRIWMVQTTITKPLVTNIICMLWKGGMSF